VGEDRAHDGGVLHGDDETRAPATARAGHHVEVKGPHISAAHLITASWAAGVLELLKEAVPKVSRVAVIWNPANPTASSYLGVMEAAAPRLTVERRDEASPATPRLTSGCDGFVRLEEAPRVLHHLVDVLL